MKEPSKLSPLYDETKQFTYQLGKDHTIQHTPKHIAIDMILNLPSNKSDSILDPFLGDGVFYDNLPNEKKYYCEIKNGLDFFNFDKKIDWIISNPPFRIFQNEKKLNAFPLIMDKSVEIANKGIMYLINWKLFNAITIHRLQKWSPFNITRIKIYQIKEWFGRYYFILFEKDKPSIIEYNQYEVFLTMIEQKNNNSERLKGET